MSHRLLSSWFLFALTSALSFSFSSCSQQQDSEPQADAVTMRIKATMTMGDNVPVDVYAFDAAGVCQASQHLANAKKTVSLKLYPNQSYRLVAVACQEGTYILPSNPALNDLITFPDAKAYTIGSGLQMGFADITPKSDGTLVIQMSYRVARLSVVIKDVPDFITWMRLSVASQASAISLAGTLSGSATADIDLTNNGSGIWCIDNGAVEAFLFPGSDRQTVFTLSYGSDTASYYCSATYASPLQAAVPYQLSGTFVDNRVSLTGSILSAEWQDNVSLHFSFDQYTTSTTVTGDTPDAPSYEIPLPGSLWKGHLVALVWNENGDILSDSSLIADQHEVSALLLSLTNWTNMCSALHATNAAMAANTAAVYTEMNLSDWSIPTEAEARLLRSYYNDDLPEGDSISSLTRLNNVIEYAGGDPVNLVQDTKKVRYLCQEASRTFSFESGSSAILNAGATVSTYQLRLVNLQQIVNPDK